MGNNKFKFSDMIPNAWFYKLKDMSKTKTRTNNKQTTKKKLAPTTNTQQQKPKPSHPKNKTQKIKTTAAAATTTTTTKAEVQPTTRSADKFPPPQNYVSKPSELIRFPEAPPRQSTKRISSVSRRKVPVLKPNYSRSFLSSSESSSSDENVPSEVDSELDFVNESSWSSSCNYKCRLSASTADIIIDLNDDKHASSDHVQLKTTTAKQDNGFVDVVTEMIDLPPILTKPINFDDTVFEATKHRSSSRSTGILSSDDQEKIMKTRRDHKTTNNSDNNNNNNNNARKSLSGSSGIRLRTNSPRLASKKIQAHARKSVSSRNRHLSESLAVVKSSVDPQRDFRDSMVEMIVENNIRSSKDLEELLACYLSLNSQEYHDVIVMAFEQIWFDMADLL